MSKLLATPAAKRIAKEKKIDLINILPSSKDGILRQKDIIGFNQIFDHKITPLAMKVAKIHKLDLKDVIGTGYMGKVMKEDVLKLLGQPVQKDKVEEKVASSKEQDSREHLQVEKASMSTTSTTPVVESKQKLQSSQHITVEKTVQEGDGVRRVAMNPMRKVIARRMTESYFDVPAVHIDNEVDMSKLLDLRQSIIPTIQEEIGYRVSVGDLIAVAVVKSLRKHPSVNASIDVKNQEIIYHDYVNLAIAVGLDNGLLTPVINRADTLSLKQFVAVSKPLLEAASIGKIAAAQLEGSTFTISNLGMFDTDSFTPIINLPNAAILGVNATKKKVVVVDDEIVIRPIMKLSLTVDHRIIDGMEGAKFLQTLKGYLENPLSLIV